MKGEALHIRTGCETRGQFVSAFHRFCDGKLCFIPTVETRPVGSALSFSVQLADGTPMLQGTCIVRAAWQDFESPHQRPGLHLELSKLTPTSKTLYKELLANRIDMDATRLVVAARKAPPKPPPIPRAALGGSRSKRAPEPEPLRAEQSARGTPLPPGVPTAPMPSFDSAPTVLSTGPVPAEAFPSLDSVPTRVVDMTTIPAEAKRAPEPRATAATVPRRAKTPTNNPLVDIEDSALDAFLDTSMAETSEAPPPGHDDTTVH